MLLHWFDSYPRRVFAAIALICVALLSFGLYLQHVVGLNPCPMCIVQRYCLMVVAVLAALTAASGKRPLQLTGAALILITAGFGAFTAARQSWLQWYPPEVVTCGRDFYGMIETFPLKRALPMIFKGSGDCTAIDWTFLGGSIANWSFLCFCAIITVVVLMAWRITAAACPASRSCSSATA